MDNKSKVGLANFLLLASICLILGGIGVSIAVGLEDGWATSFVLCLIGTVLSLISGYLKNGYFKFFN